MGRQIHSTVPTFSKVFDPRWQDLKKFHTSDEQFKQTQKCNFDKRHRAMNLPEFECDDPVLVATRPGTILSPGTTVQSNRDRSCGVQTPSGVV